MYVCVCMYIDLHNIYIHIYECAHVSCKIISESKIIEEVCKENNFLNVPKFQVI